MKILKISFQNLNSLAGEHSIDLENGLLGEAGIFSITGPTGAGKSTLLDAITLALFGKAARYEKEANPGEMMTRGTGECAAEVLFECSKGRYCAKWTRARSRKKPDGKLQNSKREVSRADTGEIIAEKLREADQMIESLTGLDYHRFLRSVLLAQGRFKEFLDADDNERGELLEKITGTEIYSRISQKAYEIERQHDSTLQAAKQKLGGVELMSDTQIHELQQEQTAKSKEVRAIKLKQQSLQTKIQGFETHRHLQATLKQSQQELLQWQKSEQAFAPSAKQLKQHLATQPWQTELIEIHAKEKQQQALNQAIEELTRSAQAQQRSAAQHLLATQQYVHTAVQEQTRTIQSIETAQLKVGAAEQELSHWLRSNASTRAIESELSPLRTLGEAARLADRTQQRTHAELNTLRQEQLANQQALAEKKAAIEASQRTLSRATETVDGAATRLAQAAEGKSIDEWAQAAKARALADEAAQALNLQRMHWAQAQASHQSRNKQRPQLVEQVARAKKTRDSHAATVTKEQATLEDKQKIYDQARLIAKLETHRAELQPDQACPLCGSLQHPYAEHVESNVDQDQQAVATQKQVLAAAEKTYQEANIAFNRLDEKLHALDQSIALAQQELEQQSERLRSQAQTAGYSQALEQEDCFTQWLESCQQQRHATDAKLTQIQKLDRAHQQAKEDLKTLESEHRVSINQLHNLEQKKTDFDHKQQALKEEHSNSQKEIAKQLAAFNQKLGTHLSPAQSATETQSHTQALEQKLKTYQQQVEAQAQQSLKLKELSAELKEHQQAHSRLGEELAYWQIKLGTAPVEPKAKISIATSEAQRRNECQAALDSAQQAAQALEHKRQDLAANKRALQSAIETLQEQLTSTEFGSIEALKSARLSESQFAELTAAKDRLKSQHDQILGRIEQTQKELHTFTDAAALSPEAEATLKKEHSAHDEEMSSHNKRLGEITLLLEQDAKARASQAELIVQIEKIAQEARPWIELNALIGSANGDKFSKFAQGLTLAQLLDLANQHLIKLNDRYHIQRTQASDLSLEIVDRYQADAIRPTRSLSGGESFLVSLALALGLSDLAGSDTRIESLFIDEGFGTLDTDTLDIALAALENLRMSNRTIGIISHVEALKHRISAQIRISKSSSGHGTVEIICSC